MTTDAETETQQAVDEIDEHEQVQLNDDGTRTLLLQRPIPMGEGKNPISEITFIAELTVGHLEEGEKADGDASRAARMIAAASGVSYGNIRKMRIHDFNVACLVIARLSGNDQATGGT